LTFPKEERLCGQGRIAQLFAEGRTASAYPVRAWALERDLSVGATPPFRIAFAVPKRRFKQAVDRNRIKRQLREAWRHGKARFAHAMGERYGADFRLDLVLLYTGKEGPDYAELCTALDKVMPRLLEALQQDPKTPDRP
jgi:ribonuclease P protein component